MGRKTKEELKSAYQKVVDGKGSRELEITSVKQLDSEKDGVIEIEVKLGKEGVRVKLKGLKVVGFRD